MPLTTTGQSSLLSEIATDFLPVSGILDTLAWRPFTSFAFASGYKTAPVVIAEIHQCAVTAPILFEATTPERLFPVMLLQFGDNAGLVDSSGAWTGGYVPGSLRIHPFATSLGALPDVLVDGSSACLGTGSGTHRVLDPTGGETLEFAAIRRFVEAWHGFQVHTVKATELLRRVGVLVDARRIPAFDDASFDGLTVIDRAAFAALPQRMIAALFACGGMELAMAHMTSLATLPALRRRAAAPRGQARADGPATEADTRPGTTPDDFLQAMAEAWGGAGDTSGEIELP